MTWCDDEVLRLSWDAPGAGMSAVLLMPAVPEAG